jgi:hypothetical protein
VSRRRPPAEADYWESREDGKEVSGRLREAVSGMAEGYVGLLSGAI